MRKYMKALALGLVATQLTGCTTSVAKESTNKPVEQTIEHITKEVEESKEKEPSEEAKESKEEKEMQQSETTSITQDTDMVRDNKDRYSLSLYKAFKDKDKNFVFSPYSITDCFSLVYDGTSGKTREEMDTILGFGSRRTDYYRNYDNQTKYYDGKGVKVANRGYINKNFEQYINKELLGTDDIEILEMNGEAADKMNKFIEDTTEKKITNLIGRDAITEDNTMVLINALYLKKSWDFDEKVVTWKDGQNYDGFGEMLDIMVVKEATPEIDVLKLSYDSDIDYEKMWEIEGDDKIEAFKNQYDQNNYCMYIICNNSESKEEKVDEFIDSLDADKLNELLDFSDYKGLEGYTDVSFEIPNFEVKTQNSIVNKLKDIGFESAFNGMTEDFKKLGPVYISDILHGAYIKVDEKGTEAAAATAMMMEACGMAAEPEEKMIKEVKADEDFVFILKDMTNDNILFMGRIMKPSEPTSASDSEDVGF